MKKTLGTLRFLLFIILGSSVCIMTLLSGQREKKMDNTPSITVRTYKHENHSYLIFNDRKQRQDSVRVVHNKNCEECKKEEKK